MALTRVEMIEARDIGWLHDVSIPQSVIDVGKMVQRKTASNTREIAELGPETESAAWGLIRMWKSAQAQKRMLQTLLRNVADLQPDSILAQAETPKLSGFRVTPRSPVRCRAFRVVCDMLFPHRQQG